jgi:hypothetical protein
MNQRTPTPDRRQPFEAAALGTELFGRRLARTSSGGGLSPRRPSAGHVHPRVRDELMNSLPVFANTQGCESDRVRKTSVDDPAM